MHSKTPRDTSKSIGISSVQFIFIIEVKRYFEGILRRSAPFDDLLPPAQGIKIGNQSPRMIRIGNLR
jgi:hypothetical protein